MKFSRVTNSRLWHAGAALFYIRLTLWAVSRLWENFGPKPKTPRVEGNFLCKVTIHAELESPDKTRIASLLNSDCGAFTTSSSGINILNRQDGKTHRGVFGVAGQQNALKVQWTENRALTVSNFSIEDLRVLRLENDSGVKVVVKL